LIDAGILDPDMGTRLAVQNAVSVAGLLLTTEVMVVGQARRADTKL